MKTKNTFKNKKKRVSAKADIRKRNTLGAEAMWEEIEQLWEDYENDCSPFTSVFSVECEIEQIKYRYWKMGLPEELCEF